mmetsp:Transcript_14549/g.24448  ORF Transcript_14549/g.24448 Transcript_14549/m.24448 type:complete len:89 (+) Transcript_14549:2834-3100(+)
MLTKRFAIFAVFIFFIICHIAFRYLEAGVLFLYCSSGVIHALQYFSTQLLNKLAQSISLFVITQYVHAPPPLSLSSFISSSRPTSLRH